MYIVYLDNKAWCAFRYECEASSVVESANKYLCDSAAYYKYVELVD